MTVYGYARVSTNGQDLAAQEAELMAADSDVLVVTRLDRLARSTRDLLNIMAAIAEREAGFRSLKDTWADTTTPHGRLMLTVLGGASAASIPRLRVTST